MPSASVVPEASTPTPSVQFTDAPLTGLPLLRSAVHTIIPCEVPLVTATVSDTNSSVCARYAPITASTMYKPAGSLPTGIITLPAFCGIHSLLLPSSFTSLGGAMGLASQIG